MAPKARLSEAHVPPPPCDLASTSIIADAAQLTGTHRVRVGGNSVLHPRCKLNSALGPITIGAHCIISERTLLAAPGPEGLTLEDGVTVETNAVVEATRLGAGTTVEVGNCKFAPLVRIAEDEVVPDDTVVYGTGQRRLDGSGSEGARRKVTEKHVDTLRGLIPSNRAKYMS
ncbi:hypothetical protein EDC01DRAFT_717724 [Geopyxis carbonaria]|nr:hypothetical protein EDC01DRAFT_717724 [Geopyxis carbonaria]